MCQVKRRSFLSLSATILGGGLIAGKTVHSLQNGGQDAPAGVHHHVQAVSVMTETANRFLAALNPEQRAKATFQFTDDERMDWHFIPKERKGLTLRDSRFGYNRSPKNAGFDLTTIRWPASFNTSPTIPTCIATSIRVLCCTCTTAGSRVMRLKPCFSTSTRYWPGITVTNE